jgi:diazepam-binding inhibitor (GABA receptor modulator, acyl-CoA-binding protein)
MDSDLQNRFETASREVQDLPERPDNQTLLKLYALYKQATAGDVSGKRPGLLDIAGRAKHDAWAARAGMGRKEAMREYIALVDRLQQG